MYLCGKKKKSKKSWKFVYILAKQYKTPLDFTDLKKKKIIINFNFEKSKSRKKSWKFVYILAKHHNTPIDFTELFFKKLIVHFNFEKKVEKNRESLFRL